MTKKKKKERKKERDGWWGGWDGQGSACLSAEKECDKFQVRSRTGVGPQLGSKRHVTLAVGNQRANVRHLYVGPPLLAPRVDNQETADSI